MLRPGRQAGGNLPTSYGGSNGFGVGYGNEHAGGGSSSSAHRSAGYDPDDKYGKRPGQSVWLKLLMDKVVVLIIICILLFGTTLYYRGKESRLMKKLGVDSIHEALGRMDSVHSERDQWRKDAKRGIQDSRAMTNEDLKRKLQDGGGDTTGSEGPRRTVEHYAKRDVAWRHQVQKLQNATAKESKRAVLERYVYMRCLLVFAFVCSMYTYTTFFFVIDTVPDHTASSSLFSSRMTKIMTPAITLWPKWLPLISCPTRSICFWNKSVTNSGMKLGSI